MKALITKAKQCLLMRTRITTVFGIAVVVVVVVVAFVVVAFVVVAVTFVVCSDDGW